MLRLLNPPTVEMPSGRRARHPGIASSLRAAITGGQIGPGERLPSSRDLAAHFGVHRHTIAEALDSLVAEGWVEAAPRRAFSVGFDLPMRADVAPRRGESPASP
jgi:GntR family transcriptional regulator/MocR family aminotransferase